MHALPVPAAAHRRGRGLGHGYHRSCRRRGPRAAEAARSGRPAWRIRERGRRAVLDHRQDGRRRAGRASIVGTERDGVCSEWRPMKHVMRRAGVVSLGVVALLAVARPFAAGSTEILWDRYGVPHIYASDREAMFYAHGWAQMRNHADLLLRLYGESRGRAAEYWGGEAN